MKEAALKNTIIDLLSNIAPEADFQQLSPDENIRESLDIDSIDFLRFVTGLNEELKVEIPESDYGKLTSIEDMVQYLAKHLKQIKA